MIAIGQRSKSWSAIEFVWVVTYEPLLPTIALAPRMEREFGEGHRSVVSNYQFTMKNWYPCLQG